MICVLGNTYHGGTDITVTPGMSDDKLTVLISLLCTLFRCSFASDCFEIAT